MSVTVTTKHCWAAETCWQLSCTFDAIGTWYFSL